MKIFDELKSAVIEQLASDPGSPVKGQLWYNTTEDKVKTYDGTKVREIGSGGAGDADTVHLIKADDIVIGDIDLTGQNADFDGGGTITAGSVTLSTTAADLISGEDQVIKYSPGANGLNDYFGFTKAIPRGLRGRSFGWVFEYKNSSTVVDNDYRLSIKQKDGSQIGDIKYYDLEAHYSVNGTSVKYSVDSFIAEDCTEVEFGFQNTSTTTTTQLFVDKILITTDLFVYKDLIKGNQMLASGTPQASYTADTPIILGTVDNDPLGIYNNSTGEVTAPESGLYTFDFYFNTNIGANRLTYLTVGGVRTTECTIQHSTSGLIVGSGTVYADKGQIITVRADLAWTTAGAGSELSVTFNTTSEHVVTPAKSNSNRFSARIANNGTASITSQGGKNELKERAIASVNRSATGIVDITFTTDFFTVAPVVTTNSFHSSTGNYITEPYNVSTTGVSVRLFNSAGTATDIDFTINLDRQEDDENDALFLAAVPVEKVDILTDEKASGSGGGSSSATTVQTRDLNVRRGDGFTTLSANQFTLGSGKYSIEYQAPGFGVNHHQVFLYDVDNTSYISTGSNAYNSSGAGESGLSTGVHELTITSATTYELRHYTSAAKATNGLGIDSAGQTNNPATVNVFSIVKIRKLR